jgi:hypothetical protein
MSPVRYELGFYVPEDGILHSHRRENIKSYISLIFRIQKAGMCNHFQKLLQMCSVRTRHTCHFWKLEVAQLSYWQYK